MAYKCSVCNELHGDLPDIGADRPDVWWSVPEEERARRLVLTSDTCILDETNFFIRGVIDIPVDDHSRSFGFGVWVSQKRENFETYLQNFRSSAIGPFFGWLCTRIAYYARDTTNLKTRAHFRGADLRPGIELEPTDHPLAVAQREGISLDEAWKIVHFHQR
jgi:hypothetical protein